MTCGCDFQTNSCITDTLLAIADAQDRVAGSDDCASGCNRAIEELIGDLTPTNNFNTIPVLLTCKGTCNLFVGTGSRRTGANTREIGISVVFRVVNVDPETSCATLELLQLQPVETTTNELLDIAGPGGIARTGICITADLNSFSTVSCMPAVNLPPVTV